MSCNAVDQFSEGVEFSLRLLSHPEEWTPISFIYHENTILPSITDIGGPGEHFRLRGYKVEQKINLQICNFSLSDSIQFRWLQTTVHRPGEIADVWYMDNVSILLMEPSSKSILLEDDFNEDYLE